MAEIKVIIADDHPLVRQGIKKFLELEPSIKVVGESRDGKSTVEMSLELDPDIVLMDINMPGMNGIEATRLIRQERPGIKIIVLTMHENEEYVYETIRCGASGYLLKDVDPERLLESIIKVSQGKSVIHPSITEKLLKEYTRLTEQPKKRDATLTARERDVLKLIARGKSNRSIAVQLNISEKTVKNHVYNIFRKIDVEDRTQAALYALKNKLVSI